MKCLVELWTDGADPVYMVRESELIKTPRVSSKILVFIA